MNFKVADIFINLQQDTFSVSQLFFGGTVALMYPFMVQKHLAGGQTMQRDLEKRGD